MVWSRRRFLRAAVGAGAVISAGACDSGDVAAPATSSSTTVTGPTTTLPAPVGPSPFLLGVASGDPNHDSVVLWAAVDRAEPVDVLVQVTVDGDWDDPVFSATVTSDPDAASTVRVIADGLDPDRWYDYRFVLDGHTTPTARTRTTPAGDDVPAEPLVVGHVSCQRWSDGFWTAYDDLAAAAPDVVVHCGDYIYETERGRVRPIDEPAPSTLDEYRAVWRRYKRDPALQAAHAVAPWLMVWDDHEVENNYQGDDPGDPPDGDAFLAQRAAAYRAWWEFTPTRTVKPDGPDLRIYRAVQWGGLARFVLLDTRQYRDDQPCGDDLGPRCDETASVTMLGAAQEDWLAVAAGENEAIWTSIVQQVVVHEWKILPGNTAWNLDQWDGYTGARRRLLQTLATAPNPVVLTGDVHSSWVSDLLADFDDPISDVVGAEFVCPSVSSGIPESLEGRGGLIELQSPHIRWSETERRGWVEHTVTVDDWTAEYRLVDDATVDRSPVRSDRTFTVDVGTRGVAG